MGPTFSDGRYALMGQLAVDVNGLTIGTPDLSAARPVRDWVTSYTGGLPLRVASQRGLASKSLSCRLKNRGEPNLSAGGLIATFPAAP